LSAVLRRSLLLAVFAALLGAAPAHASASARVVVLHCTRGLEATDRSVTFEGRIAAIPRAQKMQMRFALQARTPDSAWAKVPADGFGSWITAPRGLGLFLYDKTVDQLLAPASYRAVVDFRWRNAAGHVIRRAQVTSRSCRQPDPRPDLTASSLAVEPAAVPGRRRYTATLVNAGRGPAGPFEVDFTREGAMLGSLQIGGLAAGQQRTVAVPAVACTPGEQIAVVVDATHEVDESDETDNVLSVVC
jgi:CARDB protein